MSLTTISPMPKDVEKRLVDGFKRYFGMDKQINRVKKDIDKGDKKKGEKDVKKLQKMDKKFDKKIHKAEKMEKCDMKMKSKKK